MGAVTSYVLSPQDGSTRLLLKIVTDRHRWYAGALAAGDWQMARRQVKNLKSLAEETMPAGSHHSRATCATFPPTS